MNNHHKKKTVVDHPGNHAVLRTLLNGVILIFSFFFVLWTKCNHLLCKISNSGQYKIKKHAFCMIALILRLHTFSQILQGVHKLSSSAVYVK